METSLATQPEAVDIDIDFDNDDEHGLDNDKSMIDNADEDIFDKMLDDDEKEVQDDDMLDHENHLADIQHEHDILMLSDANKDPSIADLEDDLLLDDEPEDDMPDAAAATVIKDQKTPPPTTESKLTPTDKGEQPITNKEPTKMPSPRNSPHTQEDDNLHKHLDEDQATAESGSRELPKSSPSSAQLDQVKRSPSSKSQHTTETALDPELEEVEDLFERSDSPASAQESPAHLHPVNIDYYGEQWSLFSNTESDDGAFFLEDRTLAFEPFAVMLRACRDVLGDSIGHDDEIVLDIPSLGLHVFEDSKSASNLTLARVIDTYMLLSQNEQLSYIKPLQCRLTHRVCLSTQISYLADCATEGKTFSEVLAEHVDSPEQPHSDLAEAPPSDQDHADDATRPDTTDILEDEDVNEDHLEHDVNSDAEDDLKPDAEDDLEHDAEDDLKDNVEDDLEDEDDADVTSSIEPEVNKSTTDRSSEHLSTAKSATTSEPTQPPQTALHTTASPKHEVNAGEKVDQVVRNSQVESIIQEVAEANDHVDVVKDEFQDEPLAHSAESIQNPGSDEKEDDFELDFDDDEEDVLQPKTTSDIPPTTPSKSLNGTGKRKIPDEEDDDLLIDFSTPEPKRRRPS